MSSTQERQNIVIVGGGSVGLTTFDAIAATLDASKYNLVLITPRPFYTHLIAGLRMVVTSEGGLEDRILMPLDKKFDADHKKLIVAEVTSITDDGAKDQHVTLDNGETVPFFILVLGPGSLWEGPLAFSNTKAEILESVQSWREKFKNAKDIVLVGGGAIGAELAGEIKDLGANKNVTIVHAQSHLLNDAYPVRWRKSASKTYRDRGVNFVFDDYVDDLEIKDGHITTRAKKSIKADLVVPTRGPRPNTKFVQSLGPNALTSAGYIKVTPTLQVPDHPHIFAGGDVIDWNEQKQAFKAQAHASVIAKNVLSLLNEKSLVPYKTAFEGVLLTNGKNGGTAYFGILWGITLGNWLSSLLKSKGLAVDMAKNKLGL
ncbi:hypothetical protein GALMADRAFT_125165 [Galerina marginata CBS 339.88]|uniref:FAD/NAD(P)-binding domain-containing protein n=1 Tax=Galerina marginata (strain CBS 339.88) TaxID=685588 RepID=A0A067T288_GALM3|nr:hypothetical protein GALMADRAFT_125165 [Galerina marginata CBS 339.88]